MLYFGDSIRSCQRELNGNGFTFWFLHTIAKNRETIANGINNIIKFLSLAAESIMAPQKKVCLYRTNMMNNRYEVKPVNEGMQSISCLTTEQQKG